MNFEELCDHVRSLATSGKDWNGVLFDDSVNDGYCELSSSGELDKEKLESAFVEGRRAFRLSRGWIRTWTTACVEYDQFDTEELESSKWNGKVLRLVISHPDHAVYQRSRYMFGAWCWDEDPREVERKIKETIAREKAEDEEKKRVRDEGLVWLRSADLSARTDEDIFDNELRSRGLTWSDLRAEQQRRSDEEDAAARLTEWSQCRSMFSDGDTIVDPGTTLIGSTCNVYRNVRVVPHWSAKDDAGEARVEDERRTDLGSLWFVAERLSKGDYRIAKADEILPPAAVLDRMKPSRLENILMVESEGRVIWIGREGYFGDIHILDEQGKLVRKSSLKEAAKIALKKKEGWS